METEKTRRKEMKRQEDRRGGRKRIQGRRVGQGVGEKRGWRRRR